MEEGNFSLFETQYETPEVQMIPSAEFEKLRSNMKKVISSLNPSAKASSKKKSAAAACNSEIPVISLDGDGDCSDFVTQLGHQLSAQHLANDAAMCSVSSGADFVTQQGRYPHVVLILFFQIRGLLNSQ